MQLVRCAACRLIFEARSDVSPPACRQCGAATVSLGPSNGIVQSAADEEDRKTQKVPIIPLPRR